MAMVTGHKVVLYGLWIQVASLNELLSKVNCPGMAPYKTLVLELAETFLCCCAPLYSVNVSDSSEPVAPNLFIS